jgi:multicomponent K+:H+ antiporter subunit A
MKVPVEILVALCVLVGLLPGLTVGPLLASAATATVGGPLPPYSLTVWHGFNIPLLMSTVALIGGVLVYFNRQALFRWHARLPAVAAPQLFELAVRSCIAGATRVARLFANGTLHRYMIWLLGGTVIAAGWALLPLGQWQGELALAPVDPLTAGGAVVLIIGAVATVAWHRHRLRCLLLLSLVGLMVSLIFVRFAAPDLALTQLSVEVVTIVLFVLVLYFLPAHTPAEGRLWRHGRDAAIALLAGGGVAALTFAVMTRSFDSIGTFFIDQALPGGGGHNIVNVILVDFRGFDTLGEITVLAIAATGIVALLEGLRLRRPQRDPAGRPWARDRHPLILAVLARVVLPLALLFSLHMLLRGHNLPGGGFIAGLLTAIALTLQYVANGLQEARRRLRISYLSMAGLGVLLAAATGLGAWLFGYPFLTSSFGHFTLPLIGEIELATAMLFDLGVYLVVVGSTLLVIATLGRLSVFEPIQRTRAPLSLRRS